MMRTYYENLKRQSGTTPAVPEDDFFIDKNATLEEG